MDFKDFSVKILRDIIKKYELHYIDEFKGYSKMGKKEILNKIGKHLFIEGDLIKQKKETFETKKPRTTAQKKLDLKVDDLKAFYKKQLEGKDLLIKPLEAHLSSNIETIKRKTRKDKGIKKGKTGKRKDKSEDDIITENITFAENTGKKAEDKLKNASTMEDLMKILNENLKKTVNETSKMKKKGAGKKDIILADYKKVQNSSDKEKSMLLFVKKYPELGLDENKIIGLFDRKPWFTIDKLVFDTIMGMRGGALGILDVLDQSGKAADIADKIPFGGKIADILRGLQTGVDLVRATGSTLKNTAEQFAPGASQNPILKKNFGWLGFGRREDALKDYEKIKSSSDKENAVMAFIKKYPEIGLTESKVAGLFDRKRWFEIDRILFDLIMGLKGGCCGGNLEEESDDELEGMGRDGYGLHAVIINKRMDFETAQKKAKEITGKKKIFHRVTKDSFRFRNIPKTKFEKKTYRSKKIDKDITLVFGKLKPEFRHLQGAGLFDWIKKGFEKVKGVFNRPEKLNNTSRKTLEKYGDKNINELTIIRTPINSLIKKVLQGLSKNFKYDDLFHLGLIADVEGGKKIILEKNEVINIDDKFKSNKDSVYMKVPYSGGLKLNDLVNNSIKLWSPEYKFYEYNYKDNNCQIFVRNLLKGSNLLNAELEKFIMQDVSDLLGSKTGKVATLITDIAGVFNKLTGGKIVGDDVLIPKDDFLSSSNSILEKLGEIKNIIESNPDFKSLQPFEMSLRPISVRTMSIPGSIAIPERVSRGSDSSAIPQQVERRGSEGIMGSVRNVLSPTSARRQQRALIEGNIPRAQAQTAQPLVVPRANPLLMAQPEAPVQRAVTPKKGILSRLGEVISPSKITRQQRVRNLTKSGEGKKRKTVTAKGKKKNN